MKNIFTFFFALLVGFSASAQYGQLDSTFGINGCSKFGLQQPQQQYVNDIGIQSTSKIIVACYNSIAVDQVELHRLNIDGSNDSTFSSFPNFDWSPYTYSNLTVQPDDKILLAGISHVNVGGVISRFNPDGDIDSSFADFGTCDLSTIGPLAQWGLSNIIKTVLLPSGSIVLLDDAPHLVKLTPDGSVDQSFGNGGNLFLMAPFEGLFAITGDSLGNIFVLGYSQSVNEIYIAKFDSSGNLDSSFGVSGIGTSNNPLAGGIYTFAQKKEWKICCFRNNFLRNRSHVLLAI